MFEALYKPMGMSPMVHLGGDEVNSWCFDNDPEVKKVMNEKGFDSRAMWKFFHQRVVDIILDITKEMYPDRDLTKDPNFRIYWQESFGTGCNMSNGGVVHAWMSSWDLVQATNAGHYAVRSQGWYLDVNQPGGDYANFVDSWMGFYAVRADEGVAADKKHLALGGGPCQWGEKVYDWNLDEQVWPRTLAVAEVLWSNPEDRKITLQVK